MPDMSNGVNRDTSVRVDQSNVQEVVVKEVPKERILHPIVASLFSSMGLEVHQTNIDDVTYHTVVTDLDGKFDISKETSKTAYLTKGLFNLLSNTGFLGNYDTQILDTEMVSPELKKKHLNEKIDNALETLARYIDDKNFTNTLLYVESRDEFKENPAVSLILDINYFLFNLDDEELKLVGITPFVGLLREIKAASDSIVTKYNEYDDNNEIYFRGLLEDSKNAMNILYERVEKRIFDEFRVNSLEELKMVKL